jgi:GT2 family glycosyltransferase
LEIDKGQYESRQETLFASGCAALYRRDSVLKWEGFDGDFFAYGDDADLGMKIRLGDETCLYVPSAVVRHRGSGSLGPFSRRKLFLVERNRVWVLIKYFPPAWVLASPFHTIHRLLLSASAARKNEGPAGEMKCSLAWDRMILTIMEAWACAAAALPRMLKKRRKIMSQKSITVARIERLLRDFSCSAGEMSFGKPEERKVEPCHATAKETFRHPPAPQG